MAIDMRPESDAKDHDFLVPVPFRYGRKQWWGMGASGALLGVPDAPMRRWWSVPP